MMETILLILVLGYLSLALGDLFLFAWYKILEEEKEKEHEKAQQSQ
jgi:hypothetical protein